MMPDEPAEFDQEMAGQVIRFAVLSAHEEALKRRPVSSVPDPDGSAQHETAAEYTQRIVAAAILAMLEQGLLVIPADAGEGVNLSDFPVVVDPDQPPGTVTLKSGDQEVTLVNVGTGPRCPQCGYQVAYDLACHTYGQGDRWYACMPCDSAVEYLCMRELDDDGTCGWQYTHGLNPRNPRAGENEKRRPPWIPEGQGCADGTWIMPGVRLLGSGP